MKTRTAGNDPIVKEIVNLAYPEYRGRKVTVTTSIPDDLRSYWDGGSRTYYRFVELRTRKVLDIGTNHPVFEPHKPHQLGGKLPNGIVLVAHDIFCGKDLGITIHANSSDLAQTMLAAASVELSERETTVLKYTRDLKNTYAGRTDIRYTEANYKTGITRQQWESAKADLIGRKLLTKAGSITDSGRDALESNGVR